MAITTQELFNNLQTLGKKPSTPAPAPAISFGKKEMGDGWYAQVLVGGVPLMVFGAYNRNSGTVSLYDGQTWSQMDDTFSEESADEIFAEFNSNFGH